MAEEKVDNLLDLNDDCLIIILKQLPLVDLCATAETCKRLQLIARNVFKSQHKCYGIPQPDLKFHDHERVLKNFGDIVTKFTCITKMFGIGISKKRMKTSFDWMERYSGEALEQIIIIAGEKIVLPKSAFAVMAKAKHIEVMAPISDRNLRAALLNCTHLVHLKFMVYDGPFHFDDHRFPHLQSLCNRVRVNPDTDYNKIETFFKHHTALTELQTQFLNDLGPDGDIDLSFLKHLTNLTKLNLVLCNSNVVGAEAFAYLKHLQEFRIDSSNDERTDVMILENLASVDSLLKLVLGMPEVSHLISGIERFRNLSVLAISEEDLAPHEHFHRANIASLGQLRNSTCTELQVRCYSLPEPESIVNVIANWKEVKTIKLFCEVALSEAICKRLAQVCSSQRRKIEIVLDEETIGDMNMDFKFIEKFNKDFGTFVEIKTVVSTFD